MGTVVHKDLLHDSAESGQCPSGGKTGELFEMLRIPSDDLTTRQMGPWMLCAMGFSLLLTLGSIAGLRRRAARNAQAVLSDGAEHSMLCEDGMRGEHSIVDAEATNLLMVQR